MTGTGAPGFDAVPQMSLAQDLLACMLVRARLPGQNALLCNVCLSWSVATHVLVTGVIELEQWSADAGAKNRSWSEVGGPLEPALELIYLPRSWTSRAHARL